MISAHIVAVADVQAAIQNLRTTIEQMPEGKSRYQMEVHLEYMEAEADKFARQSLRLYDALFSFAQSAVS
jgi:hypothetical protein